MPLANANAPRKMRLVNNRLRFTTGAQIKRAGDDGEIIHTATPERPIWIGEDNEGVFMSFAKAPGPSEVTVRGYYGEDGEFVVTGETV